MADKNNKVGPPQVQTGPVPKAGPSIDPDPELIKQFLANTATELAVRQNEIELHKQELALRAQELAHANTFSHKALEVQAEDRERARTDRRRRQRARLFFGAFVVLVFAGFFGYALYLGKDQLAMEALKALVYLGAGGAGGYTAGRASKPKDPPSNESDDNDDNDE